VPLNRQKEMNKHREWSHFGLEMISTHLCQGFIHYVCAYWWPIKFSLGMVRNFGYLLAMSDLLDPIADFVDLTSDLDPVLGLIRRHDAEIADAEARLAALNLQVATAKRLLADLNRERSALETMARRSGVQPPRGRASESDEPSWVEMPRVLAVQQVLDDASGPLHLVEIESALQSHGRCNDDVALISATLAYLKRRRGTVTSLGSGRWKTSVEPVPQPSATTVTPRPVPSLSDL
jgi:hypothetical protein